MVTGAIWSDADNNGWLDLLLTREWGSVALYLNFEGKLEDRTIEAGLADRTGWWNGITGMDADGDGDNGDEDEDDYEEKTSIKRIHRCVCSRRTFR